MSALRNVAQGFRNIWGAADEYDEVEEHDSSQQPQNEEARPQASRARDERPEPSDREEPRGARADRFEKFTAPASSNPDYASNPNYGGGDGGARRLRSVSIPLRASREKNIYTLRPKSLEESCVAADYLKTGCAVVLNLEAVEQSIAVRVIDFMSGVCYGLEHQGHAMKLGDKIFLFTPGDFEISSDEIDYAENRDLIFKDVTSQPALKSAATPSAPAPNTSSASANPERRSWER